MYLVSIWGYIQTIRVEAITEFQLNQLMDYSEKNYKSIAKILLEGDLGFTWVEYDGILYFFEIRLSIFLDSLASVIIILSS